MNVNYSLCKQNSRVVIRIFCTIFQYSTKNISLSRGYIYYFLLFCLCKHGAWPSCNCKHGAPVCKR